jgi:pyrimidine deaminase RibD-like protein
MASDHEFMQLAIKEALKSIPEDKRPHPKVGVVVVKDDQILAKAYRGESSGKHAEFIALEGKLSGEILAGATVYTTLEPCTSRNHPKVPCARRLAERKVARVVIGMLDPNPAITGRGQRHLFERNIATDFFPHDLMAQVEDINRDFTGYFNEPRYLRRILRQLGAGKLTSNLARFFRYVALLLHRWWFTLIGSSAQDFVADVVQLLALVGLLWGILDTLAIHPKLWISPPVNSRALLVSSASVLYLRLLVYPFVRRPTKWDIENRKRKLYMTAALQSATGCVLDSMTNTRLQNIERNALSAIKSFIEFAVMDRYGHNFCVNLLVKHPQAGGKLVCIRRTDPARGVPTIYEESRMRKAMLTMETGETYYDGNYSRDNKAYRMVWHIAIPSAHFDDAKCIGLVCIDSLRPKHLDLLDQRRSLVLNLSPYLSLLEYVLAIRFEYQIWDAL